MKTYLVAAGTFVVVDLIWLVVVARKFYADQLGTMMKSPPNWWAAVIFYGIFIFGLVHFVIQPALLAGDLKSAVINGCLFGLVTYATYDLTNLATLNNWPLLMTLVDLVWGTALGGVVSFISFHILSRK